MPRKLEPAPNGGYRIVCPFCRAQENFLISNDYSIGLCSSCGGKFRILLATVRAKRGRKNGGRRHYLIRTIMQNGEKEISFYDAGGSDFDLRSSDIMYACYKYDQAGNVEDTPAILGNVTTNLYTKIVKPRCIIATVSCGYNSWEVKTLTRFRDTVLMKNTIGNLCITAYHLFSPYIAEYMLKKTRSKRITRKFVVSPIAVVTSKIFKT